MVELTGAKPSDYEYNSLTQVEGMTHEVITDKTMIHHDTLFKIIIIGDTGKGVLYLMIIRGREIVHFEEAYL
jgi:hypothetical protein